MVDLALCFLCAVMGILGRQRIAPLEVAEEAAQETTTALAIIQFDLLTAIIEAAQQAEAAEEAEPESGQPSEEAVVEEIAAAPESPVTMEIAYNVTGSSAKRWSRR